VKQEAIEMKREYVIIGVTGVERDEGELE